MKKYFNIAGPCHPDEHYMLSSDKRCRGIMPLIDQKQNFVIHAARQSGKTTLLLDLVRKLNTVGKYYTLYCTLESARGIIEPEKGIPAIVRTLKRNIKFNPLLKKFRFALDAISRLHGYAWMWWGVVGGFWPEKKRVMEKKAVLEDIQDWWKADLCGGVLSDKGAFRPINYKLQISLHFHEL